MAKMYLEINKAGKDILITDENGYWCYAPTEDLHFGKVNLYPNAKSFEDEVMYVLYMLRREIKAGTTYSAQDVLDNMSDEEREESEIAAYHGFKSIDDVNNHENFERSSSGDRVRRRCDDTLWLEV